MFKHASHLLTLAAASFAICAGCGTNESLPNESTWGLPSISAEGDAEPWAAPSLCAWAGSVDAIVVGEVSELTLHSTPSVRVTTGGAEGWEWADPCDGVVSPSLAIDLEIDETVLGGLTGSVRAFAGIYHISHFNPMPTRKPQGGIQWVDTNENDLQEPLRLGQSLGFALHAIDIIEEGEWSLMGEALFRIDEDGKIRVQQRQGEVIEPAPIGLDGMTVAELKQAIEQCATDSEEAEARHSMIRTIWGPEGRSPATYRTGVCHERERKTNLGCSSDADCAFDEICRDASCFASN